MLLPVSQFNKPLERIPEHRYCMVVDDDTDLINDYTKLCSMVYSNVSVQHVKQQEAADKSRNLEYNCVIVDNDSFRIGEYRGLSTVEKLLGLVPPDRIIYTSALPDDHMRNAANNYGINFVEKGRWRQLEGILKELFAKSEVNYG